MQKKLLVVMAALWLCGCSAAVKHKPKQAVMTVPPPCVVVDHFYGTCETHKGGGNDCRVHMHVKPTPGCNQYNTENILQVPK